MVLEDKIELAHWMLLQAVADAEDNWQLHPGPDLRYKNSPARRQKCIDRAKKRAILKRDEIREYHRKYRNNKRKTDLGYRIRCNLSGRLHAALKGVCASAKTMTLLGCSIESLKTYLESKFETGMNWENYGNGWHIDHIMPCAIFDLTNEEHRKHCFHFSNLQPLWAIDNIKKSDHFPLDILRESASGNPVYPSFCWKA